MRDVSAQSEIVSQGVYYALFRLIEIDELSGPEKALEWARAMVDEPELRHSFSAGLLQALEARAKEGEQRPEGR